MVIFKYVIWHFVKAPVDLLRIWINFLKFNFFYLFPVPRLLKTLLSPWRRDVTPRQKDGFDLGTAIQTFAFNIISRIIGAVVRLLIIIFALTLEILIIIAGPVLVVSWIIWPIAIIAVALFYENIIFWTVGLILILISIYFFRKIDRKPADQMSLTEILNQKWAKVIWERLGLNPRDIPKDVRKNPEENLKKFLSDKKIEEEDFNSALIWEISKKKDDYLRARFWRPENLFSTQGFARDLTYGYTPLIDQFLEPMDSLSQWEHLIGHRDELSILERILSKDKQSNALVIGEPGVGKKSLIQKFSRLVSSGQTNSNLVYKKVVMLDLNSALSGIKTAGELEQRLINLFTQAQMAGNIILVIENFHNFISTSASKVGGKDISQIISPFLEGGYFQLIALTTYQGLHQELEKHKNLMKFFEKVEMEEPNEKTTEKICQDSVRKIETRIPIKMTVQAIKEVVEKSGIYVSDAPQPEKALDLLEETAIYVKTKTEDLFVRPHHVDIVLSQKAKIPIGKLEEAEKEKLLNLEKIIHKKIINQENAVNDIASAMRRGRLDITDKSRPIGSFLFLGPTGVGKTETAKVLTETYFGSKDRMNRFDMSEYQGQNAIEKALGSSKLNSSGSITTAVRENPFSLLLLDEIEKADSGILNLFLQVLEEGWLTDAFGRKVNFRNQIIVATSNAGAEFIRESIKEGKTDEEIKKNLIDYILKKEIFKPEFLNRFDDVVVFKPLTYENLLEISRLLLNDLKERLAKQKLIFNFGDDLVKRIAELGYDPANGARPMRRAIQKRVEDLIAKSLLNNEIKKDIPFRINAADI